MITILLVDDHPVVREGLAALINRRPDMRVVGEAANGQEGLALYRQLRPQISLVDLRMPEMGGVELIVALRAEDPAARIIVLTTFDGDEDIVRAMRAGAASYVLKDTGRDELLETIRAVAAGQTRLPAAVAGKLAERLISGQELSQREQAVLELIAQGKSNKEIGAALSISEGTVKTHVNNILSKLGAADRTQAVTIALQRGIVHLG